MKNKRGLSAVVATISLVLLTFIAIAIIASFVVPFVRDNLSNGSECFPYQNHFTFEIDQGYACYEAVGGNKDYRISVRASSLSEEEESLISALKLSFIESGSTEVVEIMDGSASSGVSMFNAGNLAIPKSGEVRTYVYSSSGNFESVEAFPVLNNGRTCDRTDGIEIGVCLP